MAIQRKILNTISNIWNFLLPKDKDVSIIEKMSEKDILAIIPASDEIGESYLKPFFLYKNKLCKKAIWAIKYNKNQIILSKFSNLFYEFIIANIAEANLFSPFEKPILMPIPMYKDDIQKRGYNQSILIVEEIFKIDNGINFEIETKIFKKIKNTPHQSSLKNKNERLKNLKNCFCINENFVKNRNIILIDDVITTGTTMKEARDTLKKAGAKKVICFSIAH